jgi:hypothetical protein
VLFLSGTWIRHFQLTNVGGILALCYNTSETTGNSIWKNTTIEQKDFAIKLRPSVYDWSWNPKAPKINDH